MSGPEFNWRQATPIETEAVRAAYARCEITFVDAGASLHVSEYRGAFEGVTYRALFAMSAPIDWAGAEFEVGEPAAPPRGLCNGVDPHLYYRHPYDEADFLWLRLGDVELARIGERLKNACFAVWGEDRPNESERHYLLGGDRYRRILTRGVSEWWFGLPKPKADPRDGKPIDSFPDYQRESERRRRELASEGGRRLYACRATENMLDVIDALAAEEATKLELRNLATVLLRMVILRNDGGPLSPSSLNRF